MGSVGSMGRQKGGTGDYNDNKQKILNLVHQRGTETSYYCL